jgi:tetraprenyl-beta-curcumene synthase
MASTTLHKPRPLRTPAHRPPTALLSDRRLLARASLALLLANVRYWHSVAPIVRAELRRWRQHALAIDEPDLRALALAKLNAEGFHAEAAAMLATVAPRSQRRDVVVAIVALEILFDYLDGLTERPSPDPLADGLARFQAYTDAIALPAHAQARPHDDGYLAALSGRARTALARLPAAGAITQVALASTALAAEAQVRMHAVPRLGLDQLESWATSAAGGLDPQWREFLAAAASSVLGVHALIAAAADPRTTPQDAAEIAGAYTSTCTLLTLLDGLVDHDQDTLPAEQPRPGYIDLYSHADELSDTLTGTARRAVTQARVLPNASHHVMTLAGVVAYYTSAPGARGELAAPIVSRLQRQLAPLIYPALATMRAWRLAKRIRNRRTPDLGGLT